MLCPLQAMDVLKLLASVDVQVCHSDIKASLCTFPFPAESQASSSSLATGARLQWRLPSTLSFVLSPCVYALECLRGGSWHCEVAPTSTDWLSEAEDMWLLGSLEISWLLWAPCLPAWMGKQHRERGCAGNRRAAESITLLCS